MVASLLFTAAASNAAPIEPLRDDEVIEILPATNGDRAARAESRRLRRALEKQPREEALALRAAERLLAQARADGDPRFAGQALAAIAPWRSDSGAPDAILLMRATLEQHLHDFDGAAASLERLLARPGGARPQALLTLATVRRVQGRYADSDVACHRLASAPGGALHGTACLAENAGLRGDTARARAGFERVLTQERVPASTQAWIGTSLAELEQRAARPAAADALYRASLAREADPYTAIAYADFLIEQKKPSQALAALAKAVRSDAALLRLAIAGRQAKAPTAAADAAEMRERIAAANQRPDAQAAHGREQAMFALAVDQDPRRALALARLNVARQREPADLLVYAQAARAGADDAALDEVRRLVRETGLVDRRIEALL